MSLCFTGFLKKCTIRLLYMLHIIFLEMKRFLVFHIWKQITHYTISRYSFTGSGCHFSPSSNFANISSMTHFRSRNFSRDHIHSKPVTRSITRTNIWITQRWLPELYGTKQRNSARQITNKFSYEKDFKYMNNYHPLNIFLTYVLEPTIEMSVKSKIYT